MMGDVLAMIDDQMARAAALDGGRRRQLFLYLKEQQKALIRPLVSLNVATALAIHNRYCADVRQKVYAVCAREINKPCYYCQQSEREERLCEAEVSFMLPVFIHRLTDTRTGRRIMYHDGHGLELPISGLRLLELTAFGTVRSILAAFSAFTHAGGNIGACDWMLEQFVGTQGKYIVTTPQPLEPLNPQIDALIPSRELIRKSVLEFAPPVVSSARDTKQ